MKKPTATATATRGKQPQPAAVPVTPAAAPQKPRVFQAFLAGGEDPISVTLSGPTSDLVRWYCGVSKHREDVSVDGALYGALSRAKAAYEDDSFDEAFNFVLDDTLGCMNSSRLPGHTKRGFLSVGLDYQASHAVFDYAEATGADPRDVVNAAVLAEVPHVVDQITDPEGITDDGPGIMADHVAAAARRRRGEEAPDTPVVWTDLPDEEGNAAMREVSKRCQRSVHLEFSEAAFALLEANRIHDGFASVEEFIRGSIRGTVGAFCESMDGECQEMREMFGATEQEEGGAK